MRNPGGTSDAGERKEGKSVLEVDMIYNINCLDGLRSLPDDVIDLTVTSPPYDNLRTYNNTSVWNKEVFDLMAPELFRVTKKGGVVVWIVGDATIKGSETGSSFRQALGFMDAGFRLHDTMIFQKNNFHYPEINRYWSTFEYMFIFSKGKPKTANLITDRRNREAGKLIHGTERKPDGSIHPKTAVRNSIERYVKEFGVRTNVWYYSVARGCKTKETFVLEHPAIFPDKLAEDHILTWTAPGDLVLDPFLGSGTTAKMAILNNRHYLGYEINSDYFNIAQKRIDLAWKEAQESEREKPCVTC